MEGEEDEEEGLAPPPFAPSNPATEEWDVVAGFNRVYGKSNPPPRTAALLALLQAVLGASPTATWTGSGAIAAADRSARFNAAGDVDISYCEAGTRVAPTAGAPPITTTRDAIEAALRSAVGMIALPSRPTIGPIVRSSRFRTTAPPTAPLANSGSGALVDIPLVFPAEGAAAALTIMVQLSERDIDWTPRMLVGAYWGANFMNVCVTAVAAGGAGAAEGEAPANKLLGLRCAVQGRATFNPICLLLSCIGKEARTSAAGNAISAVPRLPPVAAAFMLDDFFRVMGQLLDGEEEAPEALASKHAHWDPAWTGSGGAHKDDIGKWKEEKQAQAAPLIARMASFKGLRDTDHDQRTRMSLGVAVDVLRKLAWRYLRDARDGAVKYDIAASRAALLALLRDGAASRALPWTPAQVATFARVLGAAEGDAEDSEGHTVRTRGTGSLAGSTDEANRNRYRALFLGVSTAAPFREPALRAAPGVLTFQDGLAAALGAAAKGGETVTTKVCLRRHLVDPGRDGAWFRASAATASRLRRWGATLGNAAITRELARDPSGATLCPINDVFWIRASKVGGYGTSTDKYEAQLMDAFKAPLDEGGFAGQPAAGAPFAGAADAVRRKATTEHISPLLTYAMKAYNVSFILNLTGNFFARQRRWASWWCDTRLPHLAQKADRDARVHAVVCRINGVECEAPFPDQARAFVAEQRLQLFGADNDTHRCKKPGKASGVNLAWLNLHPMRVLIASGYLLAATETAWDDEAAAGRVAAWRDTSALRVVGGVAEQRGAARRGNGGEEVEVDEASPEARAIARGAARDGRNKIVASCFAVYVSALSLAALASGDEAERLRLDAFASSPATAHLSRVATAYFVYDVACLALWDADFEPVFLLHGALCLWVFACSLQPFLHYMALVTLLFEASTPFLHARAVLLAAGLEDSPLFAAANWCFMLSFAASRVLFGLYAIFAPGQWWSHMEALVARGDARLRGVAVVRAYQVCAVLLSALNVFWMARILTSACKPREAKKGGKSA